MSIAKELEQRGIVAPFAAFFEQLCAIPHGSYNTKAISDYCVKFAQERGLKYMQDETNNVVIWKDGTPGRENEPAMIIQGHLDMVCDVAPGLDIDMAVTGVVPETDGEWIWAKGTTLGADNGIAVAYALAILDAKDLSHPPMEMVFTTEEEVGMDGAHALDMSVLKARRMLNMDSEDEGVFTTGCAGGATLDINIPCEKSEQEGVLVELGVDGLFGGHSGVMIHLGRANGCKVMGQLLGKIGDLALVDIQGGQKDNAISNWTRTKILVSKEQADKLPQLLQEEFDRLREQYAQVDPGLNLTWSIGEEVTCQNAVSFEQSGKIVKFLNEVPYGVQKYMESLPDLPETSLNLGILRMEEKQLYVVISLRSSADGACGNMRDQIIAMVQPTGAQVEERGTYPGWEYNPTSALRDLCQQVYREQSGKEAKIDVIHAGLECGLFCSKIPGLDVVSMGPVMEDVHTAKERVNVASAVRVWEFTKKLLERC